VSTTKLNSHGATEVGKNGMRAGIGQENKEKADFMGFTKRFCVACT
jgi:hypothetical protein